MESDFRKGTALFASLEFWRRQKLCPSFQNQSWVTIHLLKEWLQRVSLIIPHLNRLQTMRQTVSLNLSESLGLSIGTISFISFFQDDNFFARWSISCNAVNLLRLVYFFKKQMTSNLSASYLWALFYQVCSMKLFLLFKNNYYPLFLT